MIKTTLALCASLLLLSTIVSGAAGANRGLTPEPAAKYPVHIEKSVMMPMRDGVRLSTDLYFPETGADHLPAILIRTPYSKTGFGGRFTQLATMLASQGYVIAVQDKRGRYESEGQYVVQIGDADDGYDSIDWLSKQTWSNGRIGTYGCSYMGDVQILAAQRRHPALKAMIPQAAGSSIGSAGGQYKYFGARIGGAVQFAQNVSWFYDSGSKVFYHPPANLSRAEFLEISKYFDPAPKKTTADYPKLWWHLPIVDVMKLADAPPNDFAEVVSRDVTDPWWDQFNYMTDSYRADVPTLHVNSWYDFGARETIYEFEVMRKTSVSATARDNQYLLISPTTHCRSEYITADEPVGERDVGDGRFDYWSVYFKWFDYWLKGDKNAVLSMPRVQYFLLGKNEWRTAPNWPIPGTTPTKYFLRSAGHANSVNGDGTLSTEAPRDEAADHFVYDPANPVPSIGGPICCTGPNMAAGSFDQRKAEIRNDVLVYTTEPLKQGIEVTGLIDAVLHVSSSAKDTDFTTKLVDVYPDGRAYNVQEGILRARVREGQTKKVWMKPDDIVELHIEMGASSNFFLPGHRIRLEVSSSNFPRFDRNLNTGGNNYDETAWVTAANTVHHSRANLSYVVLPVIKASQ